MVQTGGEIEGRRKAGSGDVKDFSSSIVYSTLECSLRT
jgi:hypothetical protein